MKRGVAQLWEIRASWSIDDVMNQNEVLDLEDLATLQRAEVQALEAEAVRLQADVERRVARMRK